MQHNNKNILIAGELEAISNKIIMLDKKEVSTSIAEIHNYHQEIEQVAREYSLTTLLAIVDWVDLSTELDEENRSKVEALLNDDAYSKWLDVVVSLLKEYNDNLRPFIHQSLTGPQWLVKPSTILLKDIATWIAAIKVEHLSNTNFEEYSTASVDEDSKYKDVANIALDKATEEANDISENHASSALIAVDSSASIIQEQLKKVDLADEEATAQQNVFEEIDQEVLEKNYITSDVSDELLNAEDASEEMIVPLMATEKSSIDDETFERVNANPSEEVEMDIELDSDNNNESNKFDNIELLNEISQIHQSLVATNLQSNDALSAKDVFIKHLDKLSLITENTNLKSIVPIVDWTQRNLFLFQDNSTTNIEQFVITGKSWSWIENTVNCLKGINKEICLDNLTNSLTDKNWLEPLEKNELEDILVGIDQAINNQIFETQDFEAQDNVESESISATSPSSHIDSMKSINEGFEKTLPELLDAPIVVDQMISENENAIDTVDESIKETSGLKMTWDDDTHPELLMVYLEETPPQINELLPLLDKISNQQASKDNKITAARLAHTIKGGSAVVGITALADISSHLEELLDHSVTSQLNENILKHLPEVGKCINDTFDAIQVQGDEPDTLLSNLKLMQDYPYYLDKSISVDDSITVNGLVETQEIVNATTDIQITDDPVIDKDQTIDSNEDKTIHDAEEKPEIESSDVSAMVVDNETKTKNTEVLTETELSENKTINIEAIEDESVELTTSYNRNNAEEETRSVTSGLSVVAGIVATSVIGKGIVDKLTPNTLDEATAEVETEAKVETEIESTETIVSETSGFSMIWHDDTHPELLMVYLEETPTQVDQLVPLLQKISENKADSDEKHTASRMAHTIKGGSAIVGLTILSEISYRLETLLDHSVKHQLPDDILEILPKAGSCIEDVFEEVQMMGEEPEAYFGIFKKLDNYVENIDENDDEVLELSSVALPDFILNQNKGIVSTEDTSSEISITETEDGLISAENENIETETTSEDEVSISEDIKEIKADIDESKTSNTEVDATVDEAEYSTPQSSEVEFINNNSDNDEKLNTVSVGNQETLADINEIEVNNDTSSNEDAIAAEIPAIDDSIQSDFSNDASTTHAAIEENHEEQNEVIESVAVEAVKLDKLKTQEDVNNIIVEIDDIVMNLIGHSALSDQPKDYLEKCSVELDRFELMTDLSGYPELSLLSKWCQLNLETHVKQESKGFTSFIQSNEIWSWVEHVGECLRESDDMSHMSSLSVELMREDWLNAIKMEDLQTVLLALRHLEDTGTTETPEIEPNAENADEVISWDKDVHPELLAVYFQETPDQIDHVAGLLHKISRGESSAEENKEAARIAHTIKGSSGVVGLNQLLELTHHLEDILDYSVNNDITPETADLLSEASDCMESLFETIQNKQAPPDELPSVLKSLSTFSGKLNPADKASNIHTFDDLEDEAPIKEYPVVDTPQNNDIKSFTEKTVTSKVDTNEAFIRVPIKVIDKLLNLAGELVTTSNQVSDNLAKTQETNKTIRAQDERVIGMLEDLNKTIEQQEKDQQNLFSSMENSDFDSLEMDTYNELNSVASLLSEGILDSQEIDNTLSRQLNELSERLHSLDKLNKTFSDVILSSRMVTIDTIVQRLERIVRQTCRKTNKKAQLVVTGNNLNIDTDILNSLVDPLLHMLRNSIDHGIETPEERIKQNKDETGLIELAFSRDGNNILMSLKDDGAGINPEKVFEKAIEKEIITADQEFSDADAIRLILQPGFSTQENVTDISGRGVGMDVVNTSIQDLNGTMGIDSKLGEGTSFNLAIPLTLITNTTLLVKVEDNLIAIPTDTIEQIMYQQASTMVQRDDSYYVTHNDIELKTQSLGELLNWPHQLIDIDKSYNILIIKTDTATHAIHVDGIESSREVVVKRLSPWISPAKGVIGACHLNDGGVAPVINLITVANEAAKVASSGMNKVAPKQIIQPNIKKQILVVDDSLSNRKALSLIIEKTAYNVLTAVDGLDALRVMNANAVDLVFTDLEMPRMNGLELTQSIRAWNDKSKTPIVMITSRTTNKHRELATKAGVDDYLTKPVETEILLKSISTWLEAKEQPLEV